MYILYAASPPKLAGRDHVAVYVCMYVCTYVCMYVVCKLFETMLQYMNLLMFVCVYVCMCACMYVPILNYHFYKHT